MELTCDAETDRYHCPAGNTLAPLQTRQHSVQEVRAYRAEAECTGCPLAADCLQQENARHRTVKAGRHAALLAKQRERFADPAHRERYWHRGEVVETVGFLKGVLGYRRWQVRGARRVAREGQLFAAACQFGRSPC